VLGFVTKTTNPGCRGCLKDRNGSELAALTGGLRGNVVLKRRVCDCLDKTVAHNGARGPELMRAEARVYAFLRIRVYCAILDQRLSAGWRVAVSIRSPELVNLAHVTGNRRLMAAGAGYVVIRRSEPFVHFLSLFEYRFVVAERTT
jgi:hypothetical protein